MGLWLVGLDGLYYDWLAAFYYCDNYDLILESNLHLVVAHFFSVVMDRQQTIIVDRRPLLISPLLLAMVAEDDRALGLDLVIVVELLLLLTMVVVEGEGMITEDHRHLLLLALALMVDDGTIMVHLLHLEDMLLPHLRLEDMDLVEVEAIAKLGT